jgi:hypothetical protein
MGRLILAAENDRLNSCLLRVLDGRDRAKGVPQVAAYRIEGGQVRDLPILRGKQLFVPVSDGRIFAFSISDDPNQRLLTLVANSQPQEKRFADAATHMLAGPDGQLWMASDSLRKFELKTDSFKLDPVETAVGLSTQPLQMSGQRIFIARRLPFNGSIIFTQVDRDQMTSLWKVVLGSTPVAWTNDGANSVVTVSESGDLFLVTAGELSQGGFKKTALADLKLPENLDGPLGAAALKNGRFAVYCGLPQPALWVVNRQGQIERQVKLDEPLEANPVELGAGIVLPLPGRLKLVGSGTGGAPVEDLQSPVAKERNIRWVHLAAIDDTQLAAVDSQGKLARVQLRNTPVPHLAEAAKLEFEQPLDVPFEIQQGRLALADASGRLQVLDAATLESRGTAQLPAAASNAPWTVGERLYVETGGDQLHCFQLEPELKPLWNVPLDGVSLAGAPIVFHNRLIVAKQNGDVCAVDPNEGKIAGVVHTRQPLVLGPQQLGESVLVPAVDGSLHRVEHVLNANPEAGQ